MYSDVDMKSPKQSKPPKKSETIEVRLSYEDKQALQAKASKQGRTVSSVIRSLISEYVSKDETRLHSNWLKAIVMTIKSKPKSVLATISACAIAPFAFVQFAAAEDISVSLDGEYIVPTFENGAEGLRTRTFATEIEMDTNETIALQLPIGLNKQMTDEMTLDIAITTEPAENGIILKFQIKIDEEIYATPRVTAAYGKTARIEIGQEGGKLFTLSAIPQKT